MKILVIHGSARMGGNTRILADEFVRGAEAAGHEAELIELKSLAIEDCFGCAVCQGNGGKCTQNDDMQIIYEAMLEADVIAFASPVYYYSWPSLAKRVIDRSYAIESVMKNKTFYLISACACTEEDDIKPMIDAFRNYLKCLSGEGIREGGYVFGYGTEAAGAVVNTEAMEKAYDMGINIK